MVNTIISTSLYLFEEEIAEKLSKNIELCTISDCQTKRF